MAVLVVASEKRAVYRNEQAANRVSCGLMQVRASRCLFGYFPPSLGLTQHKVVASLASNNNPMPLSGAVLGTT